MTVNLKTIPTPSIGSDAHSVSSLQQMLATITSNFTELKNAYDTLSTTLAAQPTEYLQQTVPDAAKVGDKWYKTDTVNVGDATAIEAWICKTAYTVSDGFNTSQKEALWNPAKDKASQDTIASLTSLLDGKASMYQSDDPPAAMDAGDIWIDINVVSGINQAYVAKADYDYSGGTGAPAAGWTDAEIGIHFRISGDKAAQAAAADADGIARAKTVNLLRTEMPGISAADVAAELTVEIGDSWTEDVSPYQSYVCYSGYSYSDVPTDPGDRATFLTSHWKAKGDKVAQDTATAASALADSKVTNFRQLTVPVAADVLDTWFKNFAGQDRDELYVANAAYTEADTAANFATEGYGSVEAYRESFWDRNLNKDALDAADAAAVTAQGKTTDWYTNDPPVTAGAADRWVDRDSAPVGQYNILSAYDFSDKNSVTWVTTGTTDAVSDDVVLVISDYWDKISQEDEVTSLSDLANKANAYADGARVNFLGLNPPQSSGVNYAGAGGVVERPVDVGDTWVKTDLELVSTASDLFSTWNCYRSYQEVIGITFEGYTEPDRDGNGDLLAVGDVGFNTMNAYNYWVKAVDPVATEAALDIVALKDGKRATYITDSRTTNGIPNVTAALGGIQIGDIWIDEGNSFNVYKCKQAYSSDEGTFQGVTIPLYEDLATNWLLVSEPELQAQAVARRGLIDGKRKTFVASVVPNPGGSAPSNWDNVTGAELGDLWINTATSPATKYWCSTAYTSGGTTGNWTLNDEVVTPVSGTQIANKQYVDDAIAGLVDSAPGALDTLNELAAALGDDANFASTVTNSIAGVQTNLDNHAALTSDVHGLVPGEVVVGASATQTLTNKTVDADTNTISNLELDNLKAGVLVTTVGTPGSDTSIPSEQAVREAIDAGGAGGVNVVYVSVSGSGDQSGRNASNRISQSVFGTTIVDNTDFIIAAGSYAADLRCVGAQIRILLDGAITGLNVTARGCNILNLSQVFNTPWNGNLVLASTTFTSFIGITYSIHGNNYNGMGSTFTCTQLNMDASTFDSGANVTASTCEIRNGSFCQCASLTVSSFFRTTTGATLRVIGGLNIDAGASTNQVALLGNIIYNNNVGTLPSVATGGRLQLG